MSYDGYQTDVPLAENVVLLRFDYFVDASPSAAPRPPDGEDSCAYAAGSPATPVLADLGVPLLAAATAGLLTDGPACGISPFRFDADLFRIRRVRVTIRAQVSSGGLRGTGSDFSNAGSWFRRVELRSGHPGVVRRHAEEHGAVAMNSIRRVPRWHSGGAGSGAVPRAHSGGAPHRYRRLLAHRRLDRNSHRRQRAGRRRGTLCR